MGWGYQPVTVKKDEYIKFGELDLVTMKDYRYYDFLNRTPLVMRMMNKSGILMRPYHMHLNREITIKGLKFTVSAFGRFNTVILDPIL